MTSLTSAVGALGAPCGENACPRQREAHSQLLLLAKAEHWSDQPQQAHFQSRDGLPSHIAVPSAATELLHRFLLQRLELSKRHPQESAWVSAWRRQQQQLHQQGPD